MVGPSVSGPSAMGRRHAVPGLPLGPHAYVPAATRTLQVRAAATAQVAAPAAAAAAAAAPAAAVKERARAAILGALVADAATMPLHW